MKIHIALINEPDVIKLAELMTKKSRLIDEMRHKAKMVSSGEAMLRVGVCPPKNSKQVFFNVNHQELQDAIDSQSEWIIDRIYDTAIHSLEIKIVLLAEKVMKNLIESNLSF